MSTTFTPTIIYHAPRAQRHLSLQNGEDIAVIEVTELTTGNGIEIAIIADGVRHTHVMPWGMWREVQQAVVDLELEIERLHKPKKRGKK